MAAAGTVLVLEFIVLIAMAIVWGVHIWGSPSFKKRLSGFRDRFLDSATFSDGPHRGVQ